MLTCQACRHLPQPSFCQAASPTLVCALPNELPTWQDLPLGKTLICLNVMWTHLEQRSFPMT